MNGAARAVLLAALALAAPGCGRGAPPPPSVRFECADGCGTYKTVAAGEVPPPCCGLPMEPARPHLRD